MTSVEVTHVQPGVYPPQQQGYQPPSAYPQTVYPPQQQQNTYIQAPPHVINSGAPANRSERYNKRAGLVTGILQIIASGILVLLGIIVLILGSWFRLSWSIWGSICFYTVTGILGVVSKNQNRCVIIAYMVMCIISAVCAGSEMIYDAIAAGESRWHCKYTYHTDFYGYPYHTEDCSKTKPIMAMHSLSAITALGEMIIAIVGSAYCCAGCCTSSTPTSRQTTVVTYGQPLPGQPGVTVVSGGQYPLTTYPQSYPQAPPVNVQSYPQAPPVNVQSYPQAPPLNAQPPAYDQQQVPMMQQQSAVYEEPK